LGSSAAAHTPERARFLFSTEDLLCKGELTQVQFVRLLAMMSCAMRVLSDHEIRDERRVFDITHRPFQIPKNLSRPGDSASDLQDGDGDGDSQRAEEKAGDREEDVLSFWRLFRRKVRDGPSDSIVTQGSELDFPRGSDRMVANPVLASLSAHPSDSHPSASASPRSSSSSDRPFDPSSAASFSATQLRMTAVNTSALALRLQSSDKSLHIPFLTRMLNESQPLDPIAASQAQSCELVPPFI
jgi:hypothetical protein